VAEGRDMQSGDRAAKPRTNFAAKREARATSIRPETDRMTPPLSDIKILDLTRLLPGGFCSLLLADLGAEVLKVEDTGMGDYIRWAPPYYGDESQQELGTRSALYLSLNRGKRSIRLDLKSEAGREALLRLVEQYDVVLDGFRPGVLDRLGVGYERMREANPAIVFCAITGYGQDGPYTQRAGHDMNYLGLVGLLGLTGAKDGPPVQSGGQIADLGGGALMAAFGVMAALHERQRSGEGQMVDVSMADGALSWLAMVAGRYFCDGEIPQRGEQQLAGGLLCYLPYEVADGWVSCGALEPKFWAAFCNGVDRSDLIGVQFEAPGSDAWHEVAGIFRSRTREEWLAFNDEHDCCIEPVLDVGEALESELVRARQMVTEIEQPELGTVRQLGVPVKMSRTPGDPTRPAPAFGEHTDEVLREAGYSDEEVAAMVESGAAAGPSADAATTFRA
jgi:alpha-methylacyl-CoA racemase